MVGNTVGYEKIANLFSARNYQGEALGTARGSRGDATGPYATVARYGSGVLTADPKFNTYFSRRLEDDIQAVVNGREVTPSVDGIEAVTEGSNISRRYTIGDVTINVSGWSNRVNTVQNGRRYTLTLELKGAPEAVDAVKPRMEKYLSTLVSTFSLQN